ncbi:hypothetical protein [Arthrobacter sp. USHLN218]|uniref:hypothetical protein n=1 Tax=Arthrobacter sp. USHLN218 TaxID=3081232 RepID=UPI003018F45E
MPEILPYLQALGFVGAKTWLLAQAEEAGQKLSVRKAKDLAGRAMDCINPDEYKRILYSDPVGEGIAKRWMDFNHNEQAAA